MSKTSGLIGIFLILSCPQISWAQAKFIKGFAVVNGTERDEVPTLSATTVVVCNPRCEIESNGAQIIIAFPGFGPLGQLSRLSGREKELSQVMNHEKKAEPRESPPSSAELENPRQTKSPTQMKAGLDKSAEGQFPYPKDGTLFLHQSTADLVIAPKASCEQGCLLSINKDGDKGTEKKFGAGEKPFVHVTVAKGYQGKLNWTLTGEGETLRGSFEVQVFSGEAFKKALKDQRLMEILQ